MQGRAEHDRACHRDGRQIRKDSMTGLPSGSENDDLERVRSRHSGRRPRRPTLQACAEPEQDGQKSQACSARRRLLTGSRAAVHGATVVLPSRPLDDCVADAAIARNVRGSRPSADFPPIELALAGNGPATDEHRRFAAGAKPPVQGLWRPDRTIVGNWKAASVNFSCCDVAAMCASACFNRA